MVTIQVEQMHLGQKKTIKRVGEFEKKQEQQVVT